MIYISRYILADSVQGNKWVYKYMHSQVQTGTGEMVLFYRGDLWNGKILQLDFSQLYSFAINTKITVKAVMGTE
jgi:hypothetical protein